MARPVLTAFRDMSANGAGRAHHVGASCCSFPPIPEVPPNRCAAGSFVSVDLTFLGSAEDCEALILPLRTIPGTVGSTPSTASRLPSSVASAPEPIDPMPAIETSGLLRDLDDGRDRRADRHSRC